MNRLLCMSVLAVSLLGLIPSTSQAELIFYTALLQGSSENPANASPGIGVATVGYDPVEHTLAVTAIYANLSATVTAAHIHAPTAVSGLSVPPSEVPNVPPATMTPSFTDFPDTTSGVYARVFDSDVASTYNASFITNFGGGTVEGAEAAFAASLAAGTAYFNIHTLEFPGGEIRGFFQQVQPVPEP
ncbi:MAG: CHRD domain-containing protein, partial [Pirellulaceae bacterium]